MVIPVALPDGLYWYVDDLGKWEPMLVRQGVQLKLEIASHDGEQQTVSDFACTVAGPLPQPKSNGQW